MRNSSSRGERGNNPMSVGRSDRESGFGEEGREDDQRVAGSRVTNPSHLSASLINEKSQPNGQEGKVSPVFLPHRHRKYTLGIAYEDTQHRAKKGKSRHTLTDSKRGTRQSLQQGLAVARTPSVARVRPSRRWRACADGEG